MVRIPDGNNLVEKLKHEYIVVGGLRLNFQRTCRVPESQINSLPAGLGSFPVYKVSDFKSGTPEEWREDGFFMPMYRQEAMWMNFARGYMDNPKALIVGAGNINAVSGVPFDPSKNKFAEKKRRKKKGEDGLVIKLEGNQNYLVVPPQPWLDGWKDTDGKIYQFVAAEMGSGETVEGQITGEETVGGIQLIVFDPKEGEKLVHATRPHEYIVGGSWLNSGLLFEPGVYIPGSKPGIKINDQWLHPQPTIYEPTIYEVYNTGKHSMMYAMESASTLGDTLGTTRGAVKSVNVASVQSMGFGRGGEIMQKIYPDPYGFDVWQEKPTAVDVIYLVSSEDFKQVTGYEAPPTPVTYEKYQQYGLPWFELHDQNLKDSEGSDVFAKLKPVGEGKAKK